MNIEERKRVACEYIQMMGDASKRPQALEMMTDDANWWVPRKGMAPWTKSELKHYMSAADKLFNNAAVKVTITGITAEDNRVAIEAEGYVRVINGKIYNNLYHFLVVFRGEKISEVKEYLDSKHVDDAFEGLQAPVEVSPRAD